MKKSLKIMAGSLMLLFLAATLVVLPFSGSQAQAQTDTYREVPDNAPPTYPLDLCNSIVNPAASGFLTSKLVSCIQGTIIRVVVNPNNTDEGLLPGISEYMKPLLAVMTVFAIMVFGIRIHSGEQDLKRRAIGFMIRLGLVWLFAYNLGGFALSLFSVTDELICMATMPSMDPSAFEEFSQQMQMPGIWRRPEEQSIFYTMTSSSMYEICSPWGLIDSFAGRLFGFGQNIVLASGLMGLAGAALFSSTIGALVFLTGVMAFLDILFLIIRLLFIYLTSVLLMAFMIIISPLIIPMALFYTRENYFSAWLRILILSIILPVLTFAFFGLFIGIFDLLIDRIFDVLGELNPNGGGQFDAYWKFNQPKFSWLLPSDPNLAQDFEDITRSNINMDRSISGFVAGDAVVKDAIGTGTPPVQTFINPYAKRALDASGLIVAPGVDFGPSSTKIQQQLILGFLSLWIFSALIKSMLNLIPGVAQGIAKATINIAAPVTSLENTMRRGVLSIGRAI